jgi:predicted DNA-binding transcriptional regulator YafY
VKGWGWKQWPGRAKAGLPRIERGVDLIAEDRAGRLVAIQAKFRNDPDSPVRTGEVQKFVGAYRKHFPRRMLISNASSRARGIKEAVGDTEAELALNPSEEGIAKLNYMDEALLAEDLLEFGTDVEVIEPESLKRRMRASLKAVMKQHA